MPEQAHTPPPGWQAVPAHRLPEPTLWPAGLSLGATLIVWGFVTSAIVSGIGVALFGISIAGWIRDIRHERQKSE